MKRSIYLTILLLTGIYKLTAQVTLPRNSLIRVTDAGSMTQYYQQNHQGTSHTMPSSYLINVNDDGSNMGLKNYLNSIAPNNCYLHIYLIGSGQNTTMAIVGLQYVGGHLAHDTNVKTVWACNVMQPNCCVAYDSNLDGPDVNYQPGCSVTCAPRCTTKAAIRQFVNTYQMGHPQYPTGYSGQYAANTQSFSINGNQIRDFLNSDPTVTYLQIYLAEDDYADNNDKLQIVIVGVDGNGNHRYDTGLYSRVFNESIPCPKCGIDTDSEIDREPQTR